MTSLLVSDLVALSEGRAQADDFSDDLRLDEATLRRLPSGALVIADVVSATPASMAAALKMLIQVVSPTGRSIAVLGALDPETSVDTGDFADDEHDRIGRLVVRLNVQKLVVVGQDARHIHNAAGLEGSWDGESQLVETAGAAYAVVREDLGSGDVVLVMGTRSTGLGDLVSFLTADPSDSTDEVIS